MIKKINNLKTKGTKCPSSNIVRLNFVDSGNYETINIIHNKPLGIIS
ncbi:MAG: hypothetical protein AWL62_571 [Halanaerobium sp. T82-1]|nr:MAG: hypothetical protein AWL62_571 [Halanaerobium sp. T82-1]